MTRDADVRPSPLHPQALIGVWRLDRDITDQRTGMRGTATGEATFTLQQDGSIHWSERGTLNHDGNKLPFRRTYFLERHGDHWQVSFEDGRPFHPWQPGCIVTHSCGPDLYTGTVESDRSRPDRWLMRWSIQGPEKDLTIETRFVVPGGCVIQRSGRGPKCHGGRSPPEADDRR